MKRPKSLRDQIADNCIHFNGLVHEVCAAGVRYAQVRLAPPGVSPYQFPCLRDGGEGIACAKREWPSEEYIQQRLDAYAESDRKMAATFPVIKRIKAEHAGQDWSGVETCPVCGGKLHLSHAAYNGHTWGRCETDDCVAWME